MSGVKLIIGELFKEKEIVVTTEDELKKTYGEIDLHSDIIPFDFTDYYCDEMGPQLYRCWISFKTNISQEELADIKLKTNEIEKKFSQDNKRKVNLDPGYVTEANLVLASTKNYSHRIYLKHGIYAEVTLIYEHGMWIDLKWTYPDYRTPQAKRFFSEVRKLYYLND